MRSCKVVNWPPSFDFFLDDFGSSAASFCCFCFFLGVEGPACASVVTSRGALFFALFGAAAVLVAGVVSGFPPPCGLRFRFDLAFLEGFGSPGTSETASASVVLGIFRMRLSKLTGCATPASGLGRFRFLDKLVGAFEIGADGTVQPGTSKKAIEVEGR